MEALAVPLVEVPLIHFWVEADHTNVFPSDFDSTFTSVRFDRDRFIWEVGILPLESRDAYPPATPRVLVCSARLSFFDIYLVCLDRLLDHAK